MPFKKGKDNWAYGKPAWNKGTKGVMKPNKTSFKVGNPAWLKGDTGLKSWHNISGLHTTGWKEAENPNWKGDRAGYTALHHWVVRQRGRAVWCMKCGSCINIQWANISHEYKRDIRDWMELCKKCHMIYDHQDGAWGKAKQLYGEKHLGRVLDHA